LIWLRDCPSSAGEKLSQPSSFKKNHSVPASRASSPQSPSYPPEDLLQEADMDSSCPSLKIPLESEKDHPPRLQTAKPHPPLSPSHLSFPGGGWPPNPVPLHANLFNGQYVFFHLITSPNEWESFISLPTFFFIPAPPVHRNPAPATLQPTKRNLPSTRPSSLLRGASVRTID